MNDAGAAAPEQMAKDIRALQDKIERLASEVDRLTQRDAIMAVLRRYSRAIDRHDSELQKDVFWPDAVINYGKYTSERDAFVEWGNDGHAAGFAQHEHHMTNQTVTIEGDEARAETYVIYLLRRLDGKTGLIGGARYLDSLERRDGVWKISSRIFLPDFAGEIPSTYTPTFVAGWCPDGKEGAWDRSDPSYPHLEFEQISARQFASA